MIVYHGTTFDRSQEILQEGLIKETDEALTRYPKAGYAKTTYGYVYVTKDLNQAFGFSLQLPGQSYTKEQQPTIFEIEVSETELENDEDESFHNATVTLTNVADGSCKRIARNLIIGKDVTRFAIIPVQNYEDGCRYADNPHLLYMIDKFWEPLCEPQK